MKNSIMCVKYVVGFALLVTASGAYAMCSLEKAWTDQQKTMALYIQQKKITNPVIDGVTEGCLFIQAKKLELSPEDFQQAKDGQKLGTLVADTLYGVRAFMLFLHQYRALNTSAKEIDILQLFKDIVDNKGKVCLDQVGDDLVQLLLGLIKESPLIPIITQKAE